MRLNADRAWRESVESLASSKRAPGRTRGPEPLRPQNSSKNDSMQKGSYDGFSGQDAVQNLIRGGPSGRAALRQPGSAGTGEQFADLWPLGNATRQNIRPAQRERRNGFVPLRVAAQRRPRV